ncbi:aldehyde dehydrogenase family protein [Malacoplasma penetrans]|uniref:Aldehyde dehydrogenase n=1 Tax=Malacoplasma penetrans (strain HF-2) TaxID=272633 RepID=Q8EW15_MALP2|nr:aldehyde dehydrogenase family protein [Malacoplasma penetrans]RXY97190.1 aldehyde dehydrogenase family protein [Malacoplasma penetrans]BAC44181.1 aldehyde dehydrogenase [Malacoplasma penetrans HF-2]
MSNSLVKTIDVVTKFLKDKKTDISLIDIENRVLILKKIKEWVIKNTNDIVSALKSDLNKSEIESLISEVSVVLKQTNYYIKNLHKFYKNKKAKNIPFLGLKSKGFYTYKPMGTVFMINPFNYPFQLALIPLVTAIASGNFVIMKNSEKANNTSRLILKMIQEININNLVCFLDEKVSKDFIFDVIDSKPDLIFFTGSKSFGYELKKQAIANEIKIILELGSANPVIVDETADIELAARRIVWAKLMNMGQTCVAPNSIFCDEKIHDKLVEAINAELTTQYNTNKFDFVKIVDVQHLVNVANMVKSFTDIDLEKDEENLRIKPTLIQVENNNQILFQEIFAPVLFITSFKNLTDFCADYKDKITDCLALYLFSNNEYNIKNVSNSFSYGGMGVNELLLQVSNIYLPFGGIKTSGIGKYHGNFGLMEFSNLVSVLRGSKKEVNYRYFHKISKYKSLIKFLVKR